jgi:uncharacterized protein GlcG (DUF336 family)
MLELSDLSAWLRNKGYELLDPLAKIGLFFYQGLFMKPLTLTQANQVIEAALQCSNERGFKPMAVVVLDGSGHVKASQRQDGASMFRMQVATGKAWGAVGMGVASRVLAERAKDNPNFFLSLASTAQGKFLPQTGAVMIKDSQGNILGAVGASGGSGDEDEAICAHGVEAAGLFT